MIGLAARFKVCRMHGAGGGAPRGNRNALKHGEVSAETLALKRENSGSRPAGPRDAGSDGIGRHAHNDLHVAGAAQVALEDDACVIDQDLDRDAGCAERVADRLRRALTLPAIEANARKVFEYLNAVPLNTLSARPLTSSELVAIMNGFTPYAAKFDELARAAAWLDDQGRPDARRQLEVMIPDFLNMLAKYREMYTERIGVERDQAQIFAKADQFVQQNILAATRDMTRRFEVQQKAIQDVMNQNCFICHTYIGVPKRKFVSPLRHAEQPSSATSLGDMIIGAGTTFAI